MISYVPQVLFDISFAAIICLSIPLIGIATFHIFFSRIKSKGLEIFAYGSGIGVALYAVVGLIIGNLSSNSQPAAIIILLLLNAAAILYWTKTKLRSQLQSDAKEITVTWSSWFLLSILCIGISNLTIKFPDNLFDGPYVIKNHNLHVKIQTINGHLPADNYLPYLVGEFFLRDISFADERPLMPGQEVSNRPILMALVSIPFRAALDPPPKQVGSLQKFKYAGSVWPDVGTLGDDRYFRQFLVVGIVLNAMIIIGAGLLFRSLGLSLRYTFIGLLLITFSPYYISQVLFTWPKALAAFYLLLAIHALSFRGWSIVAGVFAALAYLSHPYAIVFAASFGLYLLFQSVKDGYLGRKIFLSPLFKYSLAFFLVVLPTSCFRP